MKTSNKLLLSAALTALFGMLAVMIYGKASIDLNLIEGNNVLTTEIRDTETFSSVKAMNNVRVYITQGNDFHVKVETDSNLLQYIVTEVKGNTLHISIDKPIKAKQVNVFVQAPDFEAIDAMASARITMDSGKALNVSDIELNSQAGSRIFLNLKAERIDAEANSGSEIELEGQASLVDINVSSGAQAQLFDLVAEQAVINASSGAQVRVNVTDDLSVNASSGSQVNYKGQPNISMQSVSSGAHLSQR